MFQSVWNALGDNRVIGLIGLIALVVSLTGYKVNPKKRHIYRLIVAVSCLGVSWYLVNPLFGDDVLSKWEVVRLILLAALLMLFLVVGLVRVAATTLMDRLNSLNAELSGINKDLVEVSVPLKDWAQNHMLYLEQVQGVNNVKPDDPRMLAYNSCAATVNRLIGVLSESSARASRLPELIIWPSQLWGKK